jgi:hypothetical protein
MYIRNEDFDDLVGHDLLPRREIGWQAHDGFGVALVEVERQREGVEPLVLIDQQRESLLPRQYVGRVDLLHPQQVDPLLEPSPNPC